MKQIEREFLIKLLSNKTYKYIQEQVVHVMFSLYGEEINGQNTKKE